MIDEDITPGTVGFIDLGTNSVRLLVVRLNQNRSYTVLHQLKETVRLGEDAFRHQHLRADAIDRAVAVVRRFAMLSRAAGAREIVAVATAATREADNQRVFLERLRLEAGVEVHVISGREEARLIYQGIASGAHIGTQRAACIDIGGGSTEVIVGTQDEFTYLTSLQLGAIRLSDRFFSHKDGPIGQKAYERVRSFVRDEASQELYELKEQGAQLCIGSSGTIENLADVASNMLYGEGGRCNDGLALTDLQRAVAYLRSLPVEARRKVPGLNPARADIIIGGAAILETILDELSMPSIQVSSRGLRDGLLVDYLRRQGHNDLIEGDSVRRRSVFQLGRRCNFDEAHAEATAHLAIVLFDSAREAGLHRLGAWEREMLEYAALLHRIGAFLTYAGYHRHSEYLIRNADLLGFDETEIAMIATIARYHRDSVPRSNDRSLAEFSLAQREAIQETSMFLRLAEGLERSQAQVVEEARIERVGAGRYVIRVGVKQGWELELWNLENQRKAFARVFGGTLLLEAVPAAVEVAS